MDVKVFIIFIFGICTTHAFHTLIPEGKELVYEYEATVSASTYSPSLYTSSFRLYGNLHVQKDNQNVFVKLTDIEYGLYNGLDADYESKVLPIPAEMEDFSKAFRIQYEPTGNVAGIATGKDEKQYVVNFKKGISSLFQLGLEMMEKYDNQDAYAFHTEENTVYGKGKVYYNVKGDKKSYHIDVMQEPHSTRHMYTHMLTNMDYESHMSDYDEPLSRDSQRKCVLTKAGDDKIIDSMIQTGGVYSTPFNAEGENHIVYMNQTMVLTSTKPISTKMQVNSEMYYGDLTYHVADLDNVHSIYPDFTNGRRQLKKEDMVVEAISLIKKIVDYVAEYKIDNKMPDFKKSILVNDLFSVMLYLDEKMLDEIQMKLEKENDQDKPAFISIYHQMLTEIGTHSAYNYLIKLTHDKKTTAQSFYNMFDNVKFPNKKLVDDMAEILNWDSKVCGNEIYNGAILSFGALLNKAVERNLRYTHEKSKYGSKKQHKYGFNPDNKLEEQFPDHKYYEKYIVILVNKLKATKHYDEQILILHSLKNTGMESIVQHLLPAVKGEWWKDSHLRMMAALAIGSMVTRNEDLTYEIYWPFMTNPDIPTSFRILSYYMIMKSQPSLPRLINIYWVMESMKNHELYMFHYKYITALTESETPHNRKFIIHLRQISKYTAKPMLRGLTGYHHIDYYNDEHSIGEQVNLMVIHAKHENDIVLTGSYRYTINGLTTAPYWCFLRISGFHPSLLTELKLDTTSKTDLFTWEKVMKVISNIGKNDDGKITFILATNGFVITTYSFDKDNIMKIIPAMKNIMGEFKLNDAGIDISYELSKTIILPTDMGFPAVFFNFVPDIDYTDITFTRQDKDEEMHFSFDFKFKSLRNARRGLAFYNPFLDVFQGVGKMHSMDQDMHFRFNATVDKPHHTLKLSWNKLIDDENVLYAERSYVATMVYVHDKFKTGVLQKSSSKCKNYEFITMGDEYKMKEKTKSFPLLDIGSDFVEYIFDREEPLPRELDTDIDFNADDMQEFIKSFMYSVRYEEVQPFDINYGAFRAIKLNNIFEINNIEMTLKVDSEYKKGNNYLYPAAMYKMKLHYVAGNKDASVTTWAVDAKVDMDDGHMNNVFNMNVAKTIGDTEIKVCIDGDYIWTDGDFKSKFYLSSNLIDGKTCSKADALLTLQVMGEKSEEQKKNMYSYNSCYENVKGPIENQKSLECLFEYDSLRKYTANAKYNLPDDKKEHYKDKITEGANHIFTDSDSIDAIEGIKSNEVQVIFEMPMRPAAPLKFLMYTEDSGTSFQVSEKLESGGLNTVFGSMFEFLHEYGLTEMCVINNHKTNQLTNVIGQEVEYKVPKDWSLYLGTTKTEPKFEIWMKSTGENAMALKFIFKTHTLVVEPKEKKYIFTVDGKEMSTETTFLTNDWLYYAWVKDTQIVSVYIKNIGGHVIFNGHQASIEYPQIEGVEMVGHCLDEDNRT